MEIIKETEKSLHCPLGNRVSIEELLMNEKVHEYLENLRGDSDFSLQLSQLSDADQQSVLDKMMNDYKEKIRIDSLQHGIYCTDTMECLKLNSRLKSHPLPCCFSTEEIFQKLEE